MREMAVAAVWQVHASHWVLRVLCATARYNWTLYQLEKVFMDERIRAAALEYHRTPKPGKIAVTPTKALTN